MVEDGLYQRRRSWYFNSVGQPCSADDADGKATVTLDKAAKTLNVELTEGGIVAGTVLTLNVGLR